MIDWIGVIFLPAIYGSRSAEEDIQTDIYQTTLLHKEFAQPLNVVILVKTNLKTNARSHVILFSSDLDLSYEKIIDYYKLRFQIEFNFRDAKQFWGLEDFMNLGQTAVTNAVNISFFMVNLSHYLLVHFRRDNPGSGIVDLKAYCRGFRYFREMLKMLPHKPNPILLAQIFAKLTSLGRIHKVSTTSSTTSMATVQVVVSPLLAVLIHQLSLAINGQRLSLRFKS